MEGTEDIEDIDVNIINTGQLIDEVNKRNADTTIDKIMTELLEIRFEINNLSSKFDREKRHKIITNKKEEITDKLEKVASDLSTITEEINNIIIIMDEIVYYYNESYIPGYGYNTVRQTEFIKNISNRISSCVEDIRKIIKIAPYSKSGKSDGEKFNML